MSLTDYAEHALLDHIFENTAYTNVSTVYVALGNTPIEAGTWTEAGYTSYAREAITFGAASSRAITQSGAITFTKSTGGDETYSNYAIYDALTNGNMLAYGTLNSSINVVTNSTPSIADTEIVISVTAGSNTGMSTYCANICLDFMFRNQVFAQPTIYIALATATASDATTGTTLSDPSANAYARKAHAVWPAAASGTLSNTGDIQFATPTGTWGTITSAAVCDALTNGNMLFYDNANVVDQTIGLNDDVKFLSGQFDVTIN